MRLGDAHIGRSRLIACIHPELVLAPRTCSTGSFVSAPRGGRISSRPVELVRSAEIHEPPGTSWTKDERLTMTLTSAGCK